MYWLGAPAQLLLRSSCLEVVMGGVSTSVPPLCTSPLPRPRLGLRRRLGTLSQNSGLRSAAPGGGTGILRSAEINYFVSQQTAGLPVSGCKRAFDDVNNGNSAFFFSWFY